MVRKKRQLSNGDVDRGTKINKLAKQIKRKPQHLANVEVALDVQQGELSDLTKSLAEARKKNNNHDDDTTRSSDDNTDLDNDDLDDDDNNGDSD